MPSAKYLIALFIVLVLGVLGWLGLRQTEAPTTEGFAVLATAELDGNAEIVKATSDGMHLIHTNPARSSIDIVDITDPLATRRVARVPMPGEPTSVALSPDGQWALAVARKVGGDDADDDPRIPGLLALIDIRDPAQAGAVAWIGIGPQPDSIAVTNAGKELIAIIALENETSGGSDAAELQAHSPNYAGSIQIVTVYPANPNDYSVKTVRLPPKLLRDAGMLLATMPQPEYVALSPDRRIAAVSLQENNGIVLLDPYTPVVIRAFNTGRVANRPADLKDDEQISLSDNYPDDLSDNELAGLRMPDGLAFSADGQYILSADEGEQRLTGGRGFSLWTLNGERVWDDGGEIERIAAERGWYPDSRSEHRGIEIEGVAAGRFGSKEFAFAVAERGAFVVAYDISDPAAPLFVDMLPSGELPESVAAIPSRDLLAVGAEKSGTLTLYRYVAGDANMDVDRD